MKHLSRLAIATCATSVLAVAASGAGTLQDEGSFFLRQHQTDPIEWSNWGEAAFARAKQEKKPIYVYIGATTSELSRAMQKQSFVNPQIIATLNHDFVSVLVDRDARPDLAALAQTFLQANKQLTGWPANVWLTSTLQPFDAATYLPPSEEWGKEGILNVIKRITEEWKNAPETLVAKSNEAVSTAKAGEYFELGPEFSAQQVKPLLEKATSAWLEHFDATHGGFGDAPRFAEPELLRFLLLSPGPSRDAAVTTLNAIERGAIHDPIDGGFFHRTIDGAWEFPSFQKFLGDQARLAEAFIDAAKLTGEKRYNESARDALDYALDHLASPKGGYVHAEDATGEDVASGFGWTQTEITAALGEKDGAAFAAAYGIKAEGNVSAENDAGGKWKGKNILSRGSKAQPLPADVLAAARKKLLPLRVARAKPVRDENVIIGENALFLSALVRATAELKDARYEKASEKLAAFLQSQIKDHQIPRLAFSSADGSPEDYANVALAFAQRGESYKTEALALLKTQDAAYFDAKTGRFFAARDNAAAFWMRPHGLDPAAGDAPSAEMTTLLAYLANGKSLAELPQPLLRGLTSSLNDPNGQPRGDVLLTAARLQTP